MALRGSDFEHDSLTAELRSTPPRRFATSSVIGAVVAIVVVALGAYALYHFVLAGNEPPAAATNASADLTQVQQQLDAISKRLERLEKQQRKDSDQLANLSAKAAKPVENAAGPSPAPPQKIVVVKQVPTPDPAMEKQLASLQNNTSANQQAWHATTNQLADMAGQLGAAQGAIDQNQRAVRQLLAGPAHSLVQFQLQRGAKEQRVGPVWLYLKSVDTHRQRYTLEVLVNDRWTELKDRALNELVEFFVPQYAAPLELVATTVGHDALAGYLAVPTAKAAH